MEAGTTRIEIDIPLLQTLARNDAAGRLISGISTEGPFLKPIFDSSFSILGRQEGHDIFINIPRIIAQSMAKVERSEDGGRVNSFHLSFQTELAKVLAHEVGHWQLEQRYPKLHEMDVKLYRVLSYALQYIITFLLAVVAVLGLLVLAQLTGWFIAIVAWVLWFGWAVNFWVAKGPEIWTKIIYRIAWTERFARKFALRVESDTRWQNACRLVTTASSQMQI